VPPNPSFLPGNAWHKPVDDASLPGAERLSAARENVELTMSERHLTSGTGIVQSRHGGSSAKARHLLADAR
jgi:hypothetical protein